MSHFLLHFLTPLDLGYCPPLSNSRIIIVIWIYVALHRTPNVDCYRVVAVPNLDPIP